MNNRKPIKKRASLYDAHFYNILDYFILAILVAGVLIFILYPLLCMVKQSFAGTEGFSTEVYKSIFSDNLVLVKNSVFVGNLSAFFSTIAGLLVAICVWVAGKKMGKVMETILLISMVSPPFIASLAYIQLFGRNGLITKGILGLSLNPYGWLGVVVMQTLFFASLNALMILGMLKNRELLLHLADVRSFRVDMRLMRNIFYIGVPSGVENGMFQLGKLALFSLVSTFGTASIVANAIGNTIGNFNCFAGQAINLGLAAVVSQCVGAGEYDQARMYLKKIMKATYALMTGVNLVIFALLPLIMRAYNVTAEAKELAVAVLLIHGGAAALIWTPAFMFTAFLRAVGDARFTMLASMLSMWLVRVLMAYVLGKLLGYGVIGVWVAHAILDWLARIAIFYPRYRSGKWETMGIRN